MYRITLSRLLPSLIILFCSTLMTYAQVPSLTFKQTSQETKPAPKQKIVTFSFPFENRSKKTITIKRHASACSCLGASFKGNKTVYAPGEQGEIKVSFKLSNLYGTVNKHLLIWLDDDAANKPSITLTCTAKIPVLFSIEPQSIAWKQGEEPVTRKSKIIVNDKKPILINNSSVSNQHFSYQINTIKEGWEYELVVTPKDTSTPTFGVIQINTDATLQRYKRSRVYLNVQKQKATKQ